MLFQGSGLGVRVEELWFWGLGAEGCEYWALEEGTGPAKWMVSRGGRCPHSYQRGGGGVRLQVRMRET